MDKATQIFHCHEQEILLHCLFEDQPRAKEIMGELIQEFEQTDYNAPISDKLCNKKQKKIIDLFLNDNEPGFGPLKSFYNGFGFSLAGYEEEENALLEAGAYYAIGKLLSIKCHYQDAFNKFMYTSTISGIPEKFKPLYLFRLGGIYIEMGMMTEAGSLLDLAVNCCRRYKADSTMKKLEELILYQILRVFTIQENFKDAQKIIDALKKLPINEDNIIYLSIVGYFHRNKREYEEAFKFLNRAYSLYKDDLEIKGQFSRSWFNTLYQMAFCYLCIGELAKATVFTQEAMQLDPDSCRRLGYCENLLGQIELKSKNGDPETACKHFQTAYKHFETFNDYRNMARTTRNSGLAYFKMDKYQDALQHYNQSLAYDYRTQIKVGILRTLLAKTELRAELMQYNKVKEYLGRIADLKIPRQHYLQAEVSKYAQMLKAKHTPSDKIIGESEAMMGIKKKMLKYAKRHHPVLIVGESGVGKNMVAEAMHKSSRRPGEFTYIECTSISSTLIESELFGHKKGAFTGAVDDKKGLLEEANGGAVFLDEIGDLPWALQGKLLHFFDKKTIRPLGRNEDIPLDVWIICATNRDLEEAVEQGRFRKDLYHRINDFIIQVPPLRERHEDIKDLANHFYVKYCSEFGKEVCGIKEDALQYILDYEWPGNVRELEHVIKRCIDELEDKERVSREALEQAIIQQKKPKAVVKDQHDDLKNTLHDLLWRVEKLEAQQSGGRINDGKNALNELFLIIQKAKNPLRKTDITAQCSQLEASFHYWIKELKSKLKVVETQKYQNHQLYKPAAVSVLKAKEEEGVLIKMDGGYYKLK